jgi:hypothetical protein
MRNDKLIPGVMLIMIGGVILLHNYGYVHFHWANFIYLWPIFIVIGGINLIFAHNRSAWATALKLLVLVGGFCLLIFGNFSNRYNTWPLYTYHNNDDNDSSDDDDNEDGGKGIVKVEGNSIFNEPYTADAKIARLNISGGGTLYSLSDTTNQLFNANTKEFKGRYVFNHSKQDSVYVLDFNMKNHHGFNWDWDDDDHKNSDGHTDDKSNLAIFKLNPNPEWEINVKAGATKLDFDLSKFKIRSLKLSGGAAAFNVKLGQPLATTNVTVATGMSSVVISVPQGAACHITSSTGLSSTHFDGFNENGNNYETPGFSSATNKIYINISGGMADFKVKRY